MNEIPEFVEYFSTERPLIMFGAGASAAAGLPTWAKLAEGLLLKVRTEKPKEVEPLEEAFAKQDFPLMFGLAVKDFTFPYVADYCNDRLKAPNGSGEVYSLLAKLPARGYLTTNFDSLLLEHFKSARKSSREFRNTKDQISQVDFEVPRTIVKIHGDFTDENSLVLTARQYDDVLMHPRFEALRAFTSAHLHASRLAFIGYSFRDPDLQFLLKEATAKYRRQVPLVGILANTTEAEAQELFDTYNLKVIRYRAPGGDHSELNRILQIVAAYFLTDPQRSATTNFSAAQSLYFWHKSKSKDATQATNDALQAVILGTLASQKDFLSERQVLHEVALVAPGADSSRSDGALDKALSALVSKGLIARDRVRGVQITTQGKQIQTLYAQQFQNLRSAFREQVGYDLQGSLPKLSPSSLSALPELVDSALMQIFSERGAELAESAFADRFETRGSLDLLKTINSFTSDLPDDSRAGTFAYLMDLVTRPRDDQRAYIEFLAKAFFASQMIGIDPDGSAFRRQVLSARTVILDANILIPAAAHSSARYQYFRECLQLLIESGVRLLTIQPFIDEVVWHFQWAQNLVRQYGAQSIEVFECAIGSPSFRRNEGIDGFVRSAATRDITMDEYLSECFHGPPSYENVTGLIAELGVEVFSLNEIANRDPNIWVIQLEIERYIAESQIGVEFPKAEPRIKGEAYSFAIAYGWQTLKPDDVPAELWRCSLLSQGMSLNKVSKSGPYPMTRPMVVRPDALQEAIKAFRPIEHPVTISESMLATYVHSVEHFIDKHKYSEFFRPLIKDSEQAYKDNLLRFEEAIEVDSNIDIFESYDDLDKPLLINSLRKMTTAEGERRLEQSRQEFAVSKAAMERSLVLAEEEKTKNAELARLALAQLTPNAQKRIQSELKKKFEN